MTKAARPAGIDKLVERQMRNWELARGQRRGSGGSRQAEVEDFVCVSRMVGLEKVPVAQRVGERLGWPVFDREILEAMAGDDDFRQRLYRTMDERDLNWFEETLTPLIQPEFARNDYFHRLCRTVLSLARKGHGVFVGRGADRILPQDSGFRVRLVAPREMREELYAEQHGVSRSQARREVDKLESERSEFIRRHFGIDIDDPARHDLWINLGRTEVERAVEIILAARGS